MINSIQSFFSKASKVNPSLGSKVHHRIDEEEEHHVDEEDEDIRIDQEEIEIDPEDDENYYQQQKSLSERRSENLIRNESLNLSNTATSSSLSQPRNNKNGKPITIVPTAATRNKTKLHTEVQQKSVQSFFSKASEVNPSLGSKVHPRIDEEEEHHVDEEDEDIRIDQEEIEIDPEDDENYYQQQKSLSEIRSENLIRNELFFQSLNLSNTATSSSLSQPRNNRNRKPITIVPTAATRNKTKLHTEVQQKSVECRYCKCFIHCDDSANTNNVLKGHLRNNSYCKSIRREQELVTCLQPRVDEDGNELITTTNTCVIIHCDFVVPDNNLNNFMAHKELNDMNDVDNYNDNNDDEQNDDFDDLDVTDCSNCKSSNLVLDHQDLLLFDYNRDLKLRGNKNEDDILDLYSWSNNMNVSLSEKKGDGLLKTIRQMLIRRGIVEEDLTLHKSWKRMSEACNKFLKKIHPITSFELFLPAKFFGEFSLEGVRKPLLSTQCYSFDILNVIGKACLEIKHPSSFYVAAPVRLATKHSTDGTPIKIYDHYCSGSIFQQFDTLVKAEYGHKIVPLALIFSLDSTSCSANGTFTKTPLIMWLGNADTIDVEPYLLGYVPEVLPYREEYLNRLLQRQGCLVAKDRDRIIKNTLTELKLNYIFSVIAPILKYQEKECLSVRIGVGDDSFNINVFLYFSHFVGDSVEMQTLGSHRITCKSMKCRKCVLEDCSQLNQFEEIGKIRNSKFMNKLGKLGASTIHEIFVQRNGNKITNLHPRQVQILSLLKKYNLQGIDNPLYQLTAHGESKRIRNYSFHNCLSIDYLHTLLKGSVESILSYLLLLLKAFNRPLNANVTKNYRKLFFNDKKQNIWQNAITLLDQRVISFPTTHTSDPVGLKPLNTGVSGMLKVVGNGKQSNTTGFWSGSIRATELSSILFQIAFSVGSRGEILPNMNIPYSFTTTSLSSFNCTEVFLDAAFSTLEVVFFSHARVQSSTELKVMQSVIYNSVVHLQTLYCVKQEILRGLGILNELEEGKVDQVKAIKPHLLLHITNQIECLGADSISWDTQMTERKHKKFAKLPYEISSKQSIGSDLELMMIVARRDHAENFRQFRTSLRNKDNIVREEEKEPPPCADMSFGFVQQLHRSSLLIKKKMLVFENGNSNYLHPLFNLLQLQDILLNYVETNSTHTANILKEFMRERNNTNARIDVLAALKCNGDMQRNIPAFHIRCSQDYRGNYRSDVRRSVCSSLDINWEAKTETSAVVVMCILNIHMYNEDTNNFMLVTKSYVRVKNTCKFIPYDCYKMDDSNAYELISVESINKPLCAIPSIDNESAVTVKNCVFNREDTLRNFQRRRYFLIPFDRSNKHNETKYEDYVKLGNSFCTIEQLNKIHASFLPTSSVYANNDNDSDLEMDENDTMNWNREDEVVTTQMNSTVQERKKRKVSTINSNPNP